MTTITDADRAAAHSCVVRAFDEDELAQRFAAHRLAGVLAGREAMREECSWLLVNAYEESLADDVRAIPLEPGA